MKTVRLLISEIHCPSCVALIRMGLEDISAISRIDTDLSEKTSSIAYDETQITPEKIIEIIKKETGYDAVLA